MTTGSIVLLAIAILPVIVLTTFIYRSDRYNKEPFRMLSRAFVVGVLSVLPAGVMEQFLSMWTPEAGIANGIYTGFVVAGFSEELCKLLVLMIFIWPSRYFDEYFDGIVYACFVSLGFAAIENVMYVFGSDTFASALATGSVRAVLSVPGHFLFGVSMGYYLALAKFDPSRRTRHLALALLVPALLHGTFDALLMIPESLSPTYSGIVSSVLFVVFIWFDLRLWKSNMVRLRTMQELSSKQASDGEQEPYDSHTNTHRPFDRDAPFGSTSGGNTRTRSGEKSLDDLDWDV